MPTVAAPWYTTPCSTYPPYPYPYAYSYPAAVVAPSTTTLSVNRDTVCNPNGCYTVSQPSLTTCNPLLGCTSVPAGPPNLTSFSDLGPLRCAI